jgi:hypothetical protein
MQPSYLNCNHIFRTATYRGEEIFFLADTWAEARKMAEELAGKNHRGIAIILPSNPAFVRGMQILGLWTKSA